MQPLPSWHVTVADTAVSARGCLVVNLAERLDDTMLAGQHLSGNVMLMGHEVLGGDACDVGKVGTLPPAAPLPPCHTRPASRQRGTHNQQHWFCWVDPLTDTVDRCRVINPE